MVGERQVNKKRRLEASKLLAENTLQALKIN